MVYFVFAFVCAASSARAEGPFQILGVSLPQMTKAHLCLSLGGAAKPIPFLVSHSKGATRAITVHMVDNVSIGSVVDHRTVTVRANPSGQTVVNFRFIPPCNRTGWSTSNYSFVVSGGSNTIKKLLGRYDSKAARVF